MSKIIKNKGKLVYAYELGAGTSKEAEMLQKGKIVLKDGIYYLRSTEVVNAGSEGQMAQPGDFFKIDGKGNPYPNERKWFLAHHKVEKAEEHLYEQVPDALEAWFVGEPVTAAVQYALDQELVKLNPENPDQFFGAQLWGSWLTAPKDSALMFYSITYDEFGVVKAVDFNFVIKSEIEANYTIL